jgi:beta-glucanase (GH16 family)
MMLVLSFSKPSNMPQAVVVFLFFLNGLCSCAEPRKVYTETSIQTRDTTEGYRLVWADEFNREGAVDSTAWGFEKGFVRNEELQWYQRENAWCEKGLLIIEGRRETVPNSGYKAESKEWRENRETASYTASSINTAGKHAWTYGRFMMRGRINTSPSLWPAWWTLGVAGNWPANGEIDIMEYYRNNMLANVACAGADGKPEWFSHTFAVDSLGGKAWTSRFHTWQMDWDSTVIRLYCDNVLWLHVPLDKLLNKDGSGINPFRQPHYMLLNLAIGGTNGGDPRNTTFPNRFEVDYVRVYQKK